MMQRKASARWQGGLKDGSGTLNAPSGVVRDTPYSFSARFESQPGTNPEELIALAHAGCFSMALSGVLGESNLRPDSIDTTATVTLEKLDAGWTLSKIHLDVTAKIPGATDASLQAAAAKAKAGCPVSRVLRSEITMSARLG